MTIPDAQELHTHARRHAPGREQISWRTRLSTWGPALAWMVLLFYLSSRPKLPQLEDPSWNTLFRKGGHMGVYAVLAILNLRALYRRPSRYRLAWLLTVAFAVTDELHQGLVPGRHATVMDVIIDAAGATLGLCLVRWWPALREALAPR